MEPLKRLSTTTALVALCSTPAMAQDTIFQLDDIIFSAGFAETELERSGVSASVVTQEDIEQSGEVRVIDLLSRLPGVDVRGRGPVGSLSSITVRGAGQNYVRVLVDGIDVTDPSTPQIAFDFGSLTTNDISRIEVLRGGQSAVYGSEALGGVINITTLRAEEEGVRQTVNLEAGSYNTVRGSYGVAADLGDFDYAFTLTHTQTDGFSATDENNGNTEADGFSSTRLSFALGHDLANGGRLGLNGFVEDAEVEFDEQFPNQDGTPDELSYNHSYGLRAFAELPTGAIDSTFAATYYNIERDTRGSTIRDFGSGPMLFTQNNVYTGERFGFSYLGAYQVNSTLDLSFGADFTREEYTASGDFGDNSGSSETAGIFGEFV